MRRGVLIGSLVGLPLAGLVAGGGWLTMRRLEDRRTAREAQTVIESVERVARLSTVETNLSTWQLRRDAHDLLGFIPIKCQKTVAAFYRGKVAAGFDFGQPGSLAVEVTALPGSRHVRVRLPPPRVLYIDAPAPELVVADGSLCNQIEAEDYRRLAAESRSALEREALASGILAKAEAQARDLVRAVAQPLGFDAEVVVTPSPPPAGGETALGH